MPKNSLIAFGVCAPSTISFAQSLKDIGKLEHVGGYAELAFTKLKNFGNLKYVGGGIDIRDTDINPFSVLKIKGILPYYFKESVKIFKNLMKGNFDDF